MTDQYANNTAHEGGPAADPYQEPDATPERAEAAPDLVLSTQRVYTRSIQDTGWATTVMWTAGAAIGTTTLLTYLRVSGYPETVSVDADLATGIVTITTTHASAEVSTALWVAYNGTTGQAIVAADLVWNFVNAAAGFPVPRLPQLMALWSYLEESGYSPVSIYRRYDGAQGHILSIRTYGAMPQYFGAGFPHKAISDEEASRFTVSGQIVNGVISDAAGLTIALRDAGGVSFERVDYRDYKTVSDDVVVTAPTASVPVAVQEQKSLPVTSPPAYYSYVDGYTDASPPANPKEGDVWNTSGAGLVRWIQGAWTPIASTSVTNEGSFASGFVAVASGLASTALGFFARATSTSALAIGTRALASGVRAIATGESARALANDSMAIGTGALVGASAVNSAAVGMQTQALGVNSVAVGTGARTSSASSIAIGINATVEANSDRSIAEGIGAVVFGGYPDVKVAKINQVQQQRSSGLGETSYMLHSADGTQGVITVTNADELAVNGLIAATKALVTARVPVMLTADVGSTTAASPAAATDVQGQLGKTSTFPAGTWAVQLVITYGMYRNVTGDPAGGYGYFTLLMDGVVVRGYAHDFRFEAAYTRRIITLIVDVTGIAAGSHTFNAQIIGTTAGQTNIDLLTVSGVARRTA